MIKILSIILLLYSTYCLSKEGSSTHHTPTPHRIRVNPDFSGGSPLDFTSEINFYQGSIYTNEFLEYQTKDQWFFGLYVNNIPMITNIYKQTYSYDSYIGISKWFDVTKRIKIGMGTQSGTQLFSSKRTFLNFDYIQTQYEILPNLSIGAGAFYANDALTAQNKPWGASVSILYKIVPEKLWTEFNWYSGETNISGSVLNVVWRHDKDIKSYIGIQIPATNSGNEFAGNLGIIWELDSH